MVERYQGVYTVKSGYKILKHKIEAQTFQEFNLNSKFKLLPSVAVCVWRLLLNRLPSKSKLSMRGGWLVT